MHAKMGHIRRDSFGPFWFCSNGGTKHADSSHILTPCRAPVYRLVITTGINHLKCTMSECGFGINLGASNPG